MTLDWAGVVDYSKRNALEAPKTQYELPGVTEEEHEGVAVAVVPLWHEHAAPGRHAAGHE